MEISPELLSFYTLSLHLSAFDSLQADQASTHQLLYLHDLEQPPVVEQPPLSYATSYDYQTPQVAYPQFQNYPTAQDAALHEVPHYFDHFVPEVRPQPYYPQTYGYSDLSPLDDAMPKPFGYPAHSPLIQPESSPTSDHARHVAPPIAQTPNPQAYRIVRGVAGGNTTRLPEPKTPGTTFVPIELNLVNALVEAVTAQPWSQQEREDRRRIVRIERRQQGHIIHALFLVVGLANEYPEPAPAPPGVEVVEVSCLDWTLREDQDSRFSITSVEVVSIIETLIGTKSMELSLRRREKGRIRLNLMPFWLKRSLPSNKNVLLHMDSPTSFARQIMSYKIRKPRGFDKDVRILSWDKLVPALHRALQCYYAEVPASDIKQE